MDDNSRRRVHSPNHRLHHHRRRPPDYDRFGTTTTLARPVAYADRAAAYADAVLADEVAGNAYAYGDNYAEVPDYDAASGVHSLISDYADEDRAAAEAEAAARAAAARP